MSQLLRFSIVLIAILLQPFASFAHPGHGQGESGAVHYISEPIHTMPIIAAAALLLVICSVVAYLKRDSRRPTQ